MFPNSTYLFKLRGCCTPTQWFCAMVCREKDLVETRPSIQTCWSRWGRQRKIKYCLLLCIGRFPANVVLVVPMKYAHLRWCRGSSRPQHAIYRSSSLFFRFLFFFSHYYYYSVRKQVQCLQEYVGQAQALEETATTRYVIIHYRSLHHVVYHPG